MRAAVTLPLFWRVCLINGVVFALGTLTLVVSPVTVSARPLRSELVALTVGMLVIASVNALLLRSVLHPLDRLASAMDTVDLRAPGQRLDEDTHRPARRLVTGFNDMLERLETERTTSTSKALQAQEAERHRVSRELHDEVGQSLTAVLLDLKHGIDLAPPDVAPVLERARETTRGCVEEVRRISQRLRPAALDDLGLLSALSGLATDFSSRSEVPVTVRFHPGVPALPSETELVVYRVAQEAFTNIARHARATRVTLDLSLRGDAVVLAVLDDGIGGVDPASGSGIQGMRERALMVSGELWVTGSDVGGTRVHLRVPVPEAPAIPGGAGPAQAAGRRLVRATP